MAEQTPAKSTAKSKSTKTVDVTSSKELKEKVKDVQIFGNTDLWICLAKASSESEGWMKSTKAMQVKDGCLVQVSTQQKNEDGSYVISENLAFVPTAVIKKDENGHLFLGH